MKGLINNLTGVMESFAADGVLESLSPYGVGADHYLVDLPDNFVEDGLGWDSETRTLVTDWSVMDNHYHKVIDASAGLFRQEFITTVPGQEMTYLQKKEEAAAYLAGAAESACPMIAAEAVATGVTVAAMAAMVIQKSEEWKQLGALIEGRRMEAKAAVTAATTREDKELASKIDWTTLL